MILEKKKFSVLMSVYRNDQPDFVRMALESVCINQTLLPAEIVIVKDGPVGGGIDQVIKDQARTKSVSTKVIAMETNLGLGLALQHGMRYCEHEVIYRMDSDDVSVSTRFEEQMEVLSQTNIDVLGTYVDEFTDDPAKPFSSRRVPKCNNEIYQSSKWRNPINHPSVVFYKSRVNAAGGYINMPYFEDYYLWLSMIKMGCSISNIPKSLLKMRAGTSQIGRRHGLKYFRYEMRFFNAAQRAGLLTRRVAVGNIIARFPLRVLPKMVLERVYYTLLRGNNTSYSSISH
jgi:glycosyltransferase involved in cell wall biosynthesis